MPRQSAAATHPASHRRRRVGDFSSPANDRKATGDRSIGIFLLILVPTARKVAVYTNLRNDRPSLGWLGALSLPFRAFTPVFAGYGGEGAHRTRSVAVGSLTTSRD